MKTKNLTKSEYYRSRNITVLKNLERLAPEPIAELQMIRPLEYIGERIIKYIESKGNQETIQYENLTNKVNQNQLYAQILDLNRLVTDKDDQITSLQNQKQRNEKEIQLLKKNSADLNNQMEKLKFKHQQTINYIKSENKSQRLQNEEKIVFWKNQFKKEKQSRQGLFQYFSSAFDLRLNQTNNIQQTFKFGLQTLIKDLQKENQLKFEEIKNLRNESRQKEAQLIEKLKKSYQQSDSLKQNLEKRQLDLSLMTINANKQIDNKTSCINQLQEKNITLENSIQNLKRQIILQKQSLLKQNFQIETSLTKNIQNLIIEKQRTQVELQKTQNQLQQVKNANHTLSLKSDQLQEKLITLQQQTDKAIHESKQQSEKIIKQLKSQYQQKISYLNSENNTNLTKVFFLETGIKQKIDKIGRLEKLIAEKTQKQYHTNRVIEQLETKQLEFVQKLEEKSLTIHNLRKIIDESQQKQENQRAEFKMLIEKSAKAETQKMQAEFNQFQETYHKNINQLSEEIDNKNKEIEILNKKCMNLQIQNEDFKLRFNNLQFQTSNQICLHKRHIQDLQQKIEQVQKNIELLQINLIAANTEYEKLKLIMKQKESQIENLQKKNRNETIDYEQKTLKMNKKLAQLEENLIKITEKQKQDNKSNRENLKILKLSQQQVIELKLKIEYDDKIRRQLEEENKSFGEKVKALSDSFHKQQRNSAKDLIKLSNQSKKSITSQANKFMQQQNLKLQEANGFLQKQIIQTTDKIGRLLQIEKENKQKIGNLQEQLQKLCKQNEELNEKIFNQSSNLKQNQQRISEYVRLISGLKMKQQRTLEENQFLKQTIANNGIFINELKENKINDIGDIVTIKQEQKLANSLIIKLQKDIKSQSQKNKELVQQNNDLKRKIQNFQKNYIMLTKIITKNDEIQIQAKNKQKLQEQSIDFYKSETEELRQQLRILKQSIERKGKQMTENEMQVKQSRQMVQEYQQKDEEFIEMKRKSMLLNQQIARLRTEIQTQQEKINQDRKIFAYFLRQLKRFRSIIHEKQKPGQDVCDAEFTPQQCKQINELVEKFHIELGTQLELSGEELIGSTQNLEKMRLSYENLLRIFANTVNTQVLTIENMDEHLFQIVELYNKFKNQKNTEIKQLENLLKQLTNFKDDFSTQVARIKQSNIQIKDMIITNSQLSNLENWMIKHTSKITKDSGRRVSFSSYIATTYSHGSSSPSKSSKSQNFPDSEPSTEDKTAFKRMIPDQTPKKTLTTGQIIEEMQEQNSLASLKSNSLFSVHHQKSIKIPKQNNHQIKISKQNNNQIEISKQNNNQIEISKQNDNQIEIPKPNNNQIEIPKPNNNQIEIPKPNNNQNEKQEQDQKQKQVNPFDQIDL